MRNKLSVRVSSVALAVAVSAAFVPSAANALTLMCQLAWHGLKREPGEIPGLPPQL